MFLKICGIQNSTEARAAVEAGATAIGMLVGVTHKAEDKIDEVRAREITVGLPNTVESVMVTHLLDEAEIAKRAILIGVRAVQVHDDLPPASMHRLATLLPGVRLIKAVHVTGSDAVDRACTYAKVSDALLLDSRTHDRLGGTGLTHDWVISRRIVEAAAPLPVYLAGGLKPENVEDAIHTVGPAGVDVNSGVEDNRGAKDVARIRSFLAKARAALATGLMACDTRRIASEPDDISPGGPEVRLLGGMSRGSMAHFTLPPKAVSKPLAHRTVEEVWFFLTGHGRMWRRVGGREETVDVAPGVSITIPVGAHFQFRSDTHEPLTAVGTTMPPWPGKGEAYTVEGPW